MSATYTLDYPRLRKSTECPLCKTPKDAGPIVCWPCYRATEMKYGNPAVERKLAALEMVCR